MLRRRTAGILAILLGLAGAGRVRADFVWNGPFTVDSQSGTASLVGLPTDPVVTLQASSTFSDAAVPPTGTGLGTITIHRSFTISNAPAGGQVLFLQEAINGSLQTTSPHGFAAVTATAGITGQVPSYSFSQSDNVANGAPTPLSPPGANQSYNLANGVYTFNETLMANATNLLPGASPGISSATASFTAALTPLGGVPEPSSLALFALGVVSLGTVMRRPRFRS